MSAALLQSTAPAPQDAPAIVVAGRRLDQTAKAIAECVARNCPPDEEVSAALAHAEIQFVAGDYRGARKTLHNTIGRVDRHAKAHPLPVSKIWRAESRIAAHLGERGAMQSGQFEAIDALKAGLVKSDQRILLQRLEVADAFAKQGKLEMARAGYHKAAAQARKLGAHHVEGTTLLRVAILDASLAALPNGVAGRESQYGSSDANLKPARRSVAALLDLDGSEFATYREAAQLVGARLDAERGDMAGIERLVSHYAGNKPDRAMLLYAPKMDVKNTIFDTDRPALMSQSDHEGQWVDVTFLIASDGTVKEAEALRESPQLRGRWVDPIVAAITRRRYALIAVPARLDGLRRVKRYTMTAFKSVSTGSNLASRGIPRLEMLDLTADSPAG